MGPSKYHHHRPLKTRVRKKRGKKENERENRDLSNYVLAAWWAGQTTALGVRPSTKGLKGKEHPECLMKRFGEIAGSGNREQDFDMSLILSQWRHAMGSISKYTG